MANIFLTRKCNLKCPYCFADEFVNKKNEEVTLENFEKILNFIKKDGTSRIGLIGGEPTLHPKFNKILDILNNDDNIKEIIIYTNGIKIDKFLNKLNKDKYSILINCNSPEDIGKSYKKLEENILKTYNLLKDKCTLGINLYSDKLNYSYIFGLLKSINSHSLRFSVAIPNEIKENTFDIISSFKKFKPFLFEFFKDCLKEEIVPYFDCNSFPDCFYTLEDKKILIQLSELAKKMKQNKIPGTIASCKTCAPVVDILPDMTAVRCFGLSKYLKKPIFEYRTLTNLEKYFYNQIDLYARLSFITNECENCNLRLLNKCGICYTYKLDKMETLKNFVKQNI